ncbi:C40 family peptidase [Streptomyces luteolus]|uniref:C40 family peptidase n=1 Tax=Streptomyces luteolus TaxID=3043615 RepID=A0ABT6SQK6_9ACTN|nr:C40 family peptidase [Streptomyces sp. B-S-A12]MDI3417889.1 C40 family peptidase [Streptomyces sp. B-S-A12]
MALVCAAAILAAPGTAHADPAPKDPGPKDSKSLEQVRKEMDRLYHDAAVATDAYNAAEEKADRQSDEIVRIAKAIVAGEKKVDRLKQRAGAAARAQYRGGGLPPQAQLMLSDDPRKFLDNAGRMRQGQQATKGLLGELARTQDDLRRYADDASERWRELDANRKAKAEAKKKIKAKIKAVEELESKLEKEERERLLKMEQEAEFDRQAAWIDSGALEEITGKASRSGKKAIKYATAQIGKPYEWGAEGPGSYDCSGLTSEAWISAGKTIPRTSQEQWKQLPRIDIEDMRPGDLIIYHEDASHVGMYIGDGAIVHAPRPGRDVTIAGAGSMKILGVVRPDK